MYDLLPRWRCEASGETFPRPNVNHLRNSCPDFTTKAASIQQPISPQHQRDDGAMSTARTRPHTLPTQGTTTAAATPPPTLPLLASPPQRVLRLPSPHSMEQHPHRLASHPHRRGRRLPRRLPTLPHPGPRAPERRRRVAEPRRAPGRIRDDGPAAETTKANRTQRAVERADHEYDPVESAE